MKSQLLLTLFTLALLQLVVNLRHGLLAAVLDERHDDLLLRDRRYCRLRGPALLGQLVHALLVVLLSCNQSILFDNIILNGIVLLLLKGVAQPAFGIKTEF